jgi:hypothetical protein
VHRFIITCKENVDRDLAASAVILFRSSSKGEARSFFASSDRPLLKILRHLVQLLAIGTHFVTTDLNFSAP